jgi:transposase
MSHYKIGCDAHRRYSQFAILDHEGRFLQQVRVNHMPGSIRGFLEDYPQGTPVALESVGNWYWIVDEIEAAGCIPLMAHAAKAKVMMGNVNKTDKLDAKGLATLLHLGSLPTVWLPPHEIRDERELHRTRMAFSKQRTALKNRLHSTLAKYAQSLDTDSDIFAPKWRPELTKACKALPPETQRCMHQHLVALDHVQGQIKDLEERIKQRVEATPNIQLLKTLPGVANILSIVIEREIGDVNRFPSSAQFASYAGTVPTIKASGGRIRYGRLRKQSNQYLKWAFIEAANVVVRQRRHPTWRDKHVTILYERIRRRKGHSIAVGAVARHLSEAAYWMLRKQELYKDPARQVVSRGKGQRGPNMVKVKP